MSEWPAKGDRVMYDDARWSEFNNFSRRVGRRGGTCTGRYKPVPGDVHVRWDGRKSSEIVDADWLCPFDQAKTEAPPLPVRARAARAREGKREKARQLTEAIGAAVLRALEAAGYKVVPAQAKSAKSRT